MCSYATYTGSDQTVQWRLQTTVTPKVTLLPPHPHLPNSTPFSFCASKTNAEPSDPNNLVNKSGESPDKSEPGCLEPWVGATGWGEHTKSGKWSGVLKLGLLCTLKPQEYHTLHLTCWLEQLSVALKHVLFAVKSILGSVVLEQDSANRAKKAFKSLNQSCYWVYQNTSSHSFILYAIH